MKIKDKENIASHGGFCSYWVFLPGFPSLVGEIPIPYAFAQLSGDILHTAGQL